MRTLHQMALALLIGALLIPTSSSIGTDVMTGGESIPLGPGDHCDILDADEDGVPLQGPPGLGRNDGWVDASGDEMCGELDMNDNFINFGGASSQTDLPLSSGGSGGSAAQANGATAGGIRFGETELVSPAEGVLSFGGQEICLDAGTCELALVNVSEDLDIGGNLIVGSTADNDTDTIFFDDGSSEWLQWNDDMQRFELTDDLSLNSGLVLNGQLLESEEEGVLTFGGVEVCLVTSGCTLSDEVDGSLHVKGHIIADGDISVGHTDPNKDDNLWFGAGKSEFLRFEPGEADRFVLSNDLNVNGAVTQSSSARFKEDVQTIQDPLETVLALRGVVFTWIHSGDRDLGVLAEEVAEVLPEAVRYDESGRPAAVSYDSFIPLLIEGMQDQQSQIEDLEDRVAAQDERIDDLEDRLAQLEALATRYGLG